MNLNENPILCAYTMLCHGMEEKLRLPTMQAGGYRIETECFDDPDLLWAAFSHALPTQGWLQFQSQQLPFFDRLPEIQEAWGLLLAAEAVDGQASSLSVAQDGHGGWRLARIVHVPEMPGLWDDVHHYTHAPATGALHYRRYWRLDPEQGYLQQRACFIGFERGTHDD